jgi:hypothetical protein
VLREADDDLARLRQDEGIDVEDDADDLPQDEEARGDEPRRDAADEG